MRADQKCKITQIAYTFNNFLTKIGTFDVHVATSNTRIRDKSGPEFGAKLSPVLSPAPSLHKLARQTSSPVDVTT